MADKNYSEAGFWQKLNTFARKAGHESRREILYNSTTPPNRPIRPPGQEV